MLGRVVLTLLLGLAVRLGAVGPPEAVDYCGPQTLAKRTSGKPSRTGWQAYDSFQLAAITTPRYRLGVYREDEENHFLVVTLSFQSKVKSYLFEKKHFYNADDWTTVVQAILRFEPPTIKWNTRRKRVDFCFSGREPHRAALPRNAHWEESIRFGETDETPPRPAIKFQTQHRSGHVTSHMMENHMAQIERELRGDLRAAPPHVSLNSP